VFAGFFIEFIKGIAPSLDEALRKPFLRVVPDQQELLTDPTALLRRNAIVIGPRKRYGTILMHGLVGTVVLYLVLGMLLTSCFGLGWTRTVWTYGPFLVLVPVVWLSALRHSYRGAICRLTLSGAEFCHGRRIVFCPWALFQAAGTPARLDGGLAIPVQPELLCQVELREAPTTDSADVFPDKSARVRMPVEVRVAHLRFTRGGQHLVLKDLYELELEPLAKLLLYLGHALEPSDSGRGRRDSAEGASRK
jgi:hypothetical protein